MKEFMFMIRNKINHQDSWSAEHFNKFLKSCEFYIEDIKREGKLISAQPFLKEGKIISGTFHQLNVSPFNESDEVQVGYYHIRAENLEEAVEIAKRNPEFSFSATARIEVRPIKTKEETTNYNYPNEN